MERNKTIYGVGIYDNDCCNSDEKVLLHKKYYTRWKEILKRGYSKVFHEKYPTYKDVTVCEEWHAFSNFRDWMALQNWEGKDIDKDILFPNNKIYSPKTCIFVDRYINMLVVENLPQRGSFPRGVHYSTEKGKFRARINIKGKKKHLGYFDNHFDASIIFNKEKILVIKDVINNSLDKRLIKGLKRHIKVLKKQIKVFKLERK